MTSTTTTTLGSTPQKVNEPLTSSSQSAAWTSGLWYRMENLMDRLCHDCGRVYILHRVLSRQRDPYSQKTFLEEGFEFHGKDFEFLTADLIQAYWKHVAKFFGKEMKAAAKSSTFLHQTFQIGFPKLLRLVHEFFLNVNVLSGSQNVDPYQR